MTWLGLRASGCIRRTWPSSSSALRRSLRSAWKLSSSAASSSATPRGRRARPCPPQRDGNLFLLSLALAREPRQGAVGEIEEGKKQGLQLGRVADPFESVVLDAIGEPVAVRHSLLVGSELQSGEPRAGEIDLYAPAGPLPQRLDADPEGRIAPALELCLVPGLDPLEDLHPAMLRPARSDRQLSLLGRDFARCPDARLDRPVHRPAGAVEVRRLAGEMQRAHALGERPLRAHGPHRHPAVRAPRKPVLLPA